jgi:hypothetical protein
MAAASPQSVEIPTQLKPIVGIKFTVWHVIEIVLV